VREGRRKKEKGKRKKEKGRRKKEDVMAKERGWMVTTGVAAGNPHISATFELFFVGAEGGGGKLTIKRCTFMYIAIKYVMS
jgi:hypothetical protein